MNRNALTELKLETTPALKIPIRDILTEAMVIELAFKKEEDVETIQEFLNHVTANGLYMFFSPESLSVLTDYMANNIVVRSFVLSMMERTTVMIDALGNQEVNDLWWIPYVEVIDRIRSCYAVAANEPSQTVLPIDVCASLHDPDTGLSSFISANPWMLPIYIGISTGAFNEVVFSFLNPSTQK